MKAASASSVREGDNLFDLDTILPDQYYATFKRGHYGDPEKRLMVAILEDAVSCLSKDFHTSTRQQRKSCAEADNWINAEGEDDWIFSFTSVCESLGFDPGYLRRGLTHWAVVNRTNTAQLPRIKKYRSGARHRKLRFRAAL
jgi:hypothetical protein